VTVQLLLLQHDVLGMHEFVVEHTLSFAGHSQVPPLPVLPTQVSPVTEQSAVLQHVPTVMQELEAAQKVVPDGQLQVPPGTGQVSPVIVQSALVQHAVDAMQELLVGQTLLPAAQAHTPPGPEQASPRTVQSELVQQVVFEMHALFAAQTR
jgi:hypothetical protein